MQPPILEQVRTSLLEKRTALSHWLAGTPAPARSIHLGPADEMAVSDHLEKRDE